MNTQSPTVQMDAGTIMENVIVKGDLGRLTPEERSKYYATICKSMGLNPLSQPFEYITLNGKLRLYARKDATDQLRKIHGVSVLEMNEVTVGDLTVITVKVRDAGGRTDMAKGAVSLKGLQGEALANAIMKAETKAKRRATLSICGLGFLDETEIDDIADAKRPMPRGVPKHTVRDRSEVVWDEEGERAPNLADIDHEENERRSEEYGEMQGERLTKALWHSLPMVKQAAIRCKDRVFWKFVEETAGIRFMTPEDAAAWVKKSCGIESRTELDTNRMAAGHWSNIQAKFLAWKYANPPAPASSTTPQSAEAVDDRKAGEQSLETAVPQATTQPPTPSDHPAGDDTPVPSSAGTSEPPRRPVPANRFAPTPHTVSESERIANLDKKLSFAAELGTNNLEVAWFKLEPKDRKTLKVALDRRHKPRAAEVDKAPR